MSIILQIGSVDMSDYVEQSSVNISTAPVYSGVSFTNIFGQEIKEYLGERVNISASFDGIPEDVMLKINAACSLDTVSITYSDPDEQTVAFEHPSVNRAMSYTDGVTTYWDMSLSAVCSLKSDSL